MSVLIQHLKTGLYLKRATTWVSLKSSPLSFPNAVEAISFCIHRSIRNVRLVQEAGSEGKERFFYPFGQDPAIKAERKKLRRSLAENRRLQKQKRMLAARIDMLLAGAKEHKKQVPFNPKKDLSAE